MNNALAVNVGQHRQHLPQKLAHLRLREGQPLGQALVQQIAVGDPIDIVLHQKQPLVFFKNGLKLRNLRVFDVVENGGFPLKELERLLRELIALLGF